MPTLKNITCRVLWPEGTAFKEVATTYGDGIVETYIPIPSNLPQKFFIHVRSRGYIYEGLAVVVFIDGVYQCNRNRVNLIRPKNGKPVQAAEPIKRGPRKGQHINLSEIEWNLRQEEKSLDRREHFLGSDWRFDDFHPVRDQDVSDAGEDNFRGLGTIDVIVMRCCPHSRDKIAPDDYDSGAESDILGNHLIDDDLGPTDPPKPASKEKKAAAQDGKKDSANESDDEGQKKPEPGKKKGGKNGDDGGDKGKTGKTDNVDKSGKAKDGQAAKSDKQGKPDGGGKGGKGDKGGSAKQDKRKPATVVEDDDDDSVGETASIRSFDGPADDYYRGNRHYHDPRWPGYSQSNQYGYPNQSRNGQPSQAQGKHVHWDMGPGHPMPHDTRYSDGADAPHMRTHYTPGLSQHPGYGHYPGYDYSHGHQYKPQPPPYTNSHGLMDPYHGYSSSHYPPLTYPPPPQQGPPNLQGPTHPQDPLSRYPPQVGYGAWPQYPPNANANANQPPAQPMTNGQAVTDEAGGWKYVEPKRKADDLPTITKFNGWEFDKKKGTWVPAKDANAKKVGDSGNDDATNRDSSGEKDEWGNPVNKDSQDDDNMSNTDGDNQNKSDDGWGGNQDNNPSGGDDSSKGTDNNAQSGSGGSGWTDPAMNTTSTNTAANDWQGNSNNQSSSEANAPAANAAADVPRADRTLHGPLGAYFGPKIAVEPESKVPWIADEPPAYDLPDSIIRKLGISKQVQRGKGYNYIKKHRKPIYIDSVSEPYARFVFKYRTRDKLPRGFDKLEELEPTPDYLIQQLQERKKEDLIAELQRWRLAYGDKAPEPKMEPKRPQKEPDHTAWNLDLPNRDYLNYQLPGQFPDAESGEQAATGQQNGGPGRKTNNYNNNNQNNAGSSTGKPAETRNGDSTAPAVASWNTLTANNNAVDGGNNPAGGW